MYYQFSAPARFAEGPQVDCVGICDKEQQDRDMNYRLKTDKINMKEERPDD